MSDIDPRIRAEMHAIADEARPGADLFERVQHRVRVRRRRRAAAAVVAAGGAVAVAVVVAIALRSSTPRSAVSVQPKVGTSSTVTTASSTTTIAPPTTIGAEQALAAFVASRPDVVVHSAPFTYGSGVVAVVGLEPDPSHRSIVVVSIAHGSATPVATLVLPAPSYDFARNLPVRTGDVTGDGLPDALVRFDAADNAPGVIVSGDGGTWRLVPQGAVPDAVYIGRDPAIVAGQLRSTRNDCVPDCAQGQTTTVVWEYDRAHGDLAINRDDALLDGADGKNRGLRLHDDSGERIDLIHAEIADCERASQKVSGL